VRSSLALAALLVAAYVAPCRADETPIRVSILRHQLQVVVSSDGGLTVRRSDSGSGSPYVAPDVTTVLDIRPKNGGLLLAGAIQAGPTLEVSPAAGYTMAIDGRGYRGAAIVQADVDGTLDVINVVDLEQYLYGVVGSEMETSWAPAALQAQAIVARTYAVAHLGTREWLGYDLFAGEQDQAYSGMDAETPGVIAAVDATRGTVLVYDSQLVHAYYSSCDGGFTSGGEALEDPQPYLRAVVDPFCTLSPDDHWTADVPLDDFTTAFAARYGDIGPIVEVAAGGDDDSGRLVSVTVRGTLDARTIPATVFRALAGNHLVRSTRIVSMAVSGSEIHVVGSGFGHGVGMAQWGAQSMANAGRSVHDILSFYYPGAQFAQIADTLGH
jgi:stage II sporulation protein D